MTGTTLVAMTKDGARLDVHPSCVADHERLGWLVAPPDEAAELQADAAADQPEPKRRGRPPKARE